MRQIDEFTIQRFRGLRDLKLEELGQVNLLVGGNNTGKTSVLEALSIFCDPLNFRTWFNAVTMREITSGPYRLSLRNQLLWLFPQNRSEISAENSDIALYATGNSPREKVSARYETFSEINPENSSYVLEDRMGNAVGIPGESEGIRVYVTTAMRRDKPLLREQKVEDVIALFEIREGKDNPIEKYVSYALPQQFISAPSHRLNDLPLLIWSQAVTANMKKETIALMQLFDADIEDVNIVTPTPRQTFVSVKHKRLGHGPLSTFGDGLRHAFTLASAIPGARNGLLLVDELEEAIHVDVLGKVFSWLIQACIRNNVQIFATTHSLEAIDYIIDACSEEPIDLVAYRLEQYQNQIIVNRLDKGLLTRLRENLSMEVR